MLAINLTANSNTVDKNDVQAQTSEITAVVAEVPGIQAANIDNQYMIETQSSVMDVSMTSISLYQISDVTLTDNAIQETSYGSLTIAANNGNNAVVNYLYQVDGSIIKGENFGSINKFVYQQNLGSNEINWQDAIQETSYGYLILGDNNTVVNIYWMSGITTIDEGFGEMNKFVYQQKSNGSLTTNNRVNVIAVIGILIV